MNLLEVLEQYQSLLKIDENEAHDFLRDTVDSTLIQHIEACFLRNGTPIRSSGPNRDFMFTGTIVFY